MSRSLKCPFCGSENVDAPTVDIGVGEQQCGPAGCENCLSSQMYPHELEDEEAMSRATAEEKHFGWWKAEK